LPYADAGYFRTNLDYEPNKKWPAFSRAILRQNPFNAIGMQRKKIYYSKHNSFCPEKQQFVNDGTHIFNCIKF